MLQAPHVEGRIAITSLSAVCRTGAILIAVIDLQTRSRWIRDKDPNNSYRYPPWLYRLFWFRGAPDRVRPSAYVRSLEANGWGRIVVRPLSRIEEDQVGKVDAEFRGADDQMTLLSVALCATKVTAVQH